MIELEVAVEKLNNMTKAEIIEEASLLKCEHVKSSASRCIIANILQNWTGNDEIYVDGEDAHSVYDEGNYHELAPHVQGLILEFDRGFIKT